MDIMLQRILSLIPAHHGGDKDFALSIGYKNGNVIADWKAGRSQSYKKKLHEISAVYNVSIDWLCGLADENKKPVVKNDEQDAMITELLSYIESLTDKNKLVALDILRSLKNSQE